MKSIIGMVICLLISACGSKRETSTGNLGSSVGAGESSGSEFIPGTCGNPESCGMLEKINAIRQDNGVQALPVDSACQSAAQAHAEDMAANDYFDHTGIDGSSVSDRVKRYGGTTGAGENIAWGSSSINETASLWMGSAGHRENILSSSYYSTGIGYAIGDGGSYWVQCFRL